MLEVMVVQIPVVSRIGMGAERFDQAGVIKPLLISTISAPGR
jgi:hypothetical protein